MAKRNEAPDIYGFALAGLFNLAANCPGMDRAVLERLASHQAAVAALAGSALTALRSSLEQPHEKDAALVEVGRRFSLTLVELLCLRLTMAAEEEVEIGHAIALLQAPVASHRPTVGLLAKTFGESLGVRAVQIVGHGAAVRNGVLRLGAEDVPLAERQLSVPLPTCLALQNVFALWPGTRLLDLSLAVPLGAQAQDALARMARQIAGSDSPEVVVIRSGEPIEARAAALQLCEQIDSPPVVIETDQLDGVAPWLYVHRGIPVFAMQLAPGDCRPAPQVPGFPGPTVVVAGPDGEFAGDGRRITDWRVPMPASEERLQLWRQHLPESLARTVAAQHRHSAARIATLARDAACAHGPGPCQVEDLESALRQAPAGLSAMAEHVPDQVGDDAMVVSPELKRDLEDLVRRCRMRDGLVDGFGPSLRARYRCGVRVLLVGPTGTGKTLAASWIATRLGLPLFRVDLSAVTSKYIGETEKNLSQLLSRAEDNEIVLLFDEADSLFGKRTEVRDAHDRFANAQTNFLLQRLENYDGIVLLTSNSRARFDSAFGRRLDVILEFAAPGAEDRRELWLAHLGSRHRLTAGEINRIAAAAELSGGQIRGAVLSAAIQAGKHGGPIDYGDLVAGLHSEYRKLGRELPEELQRAPVESPAAAGDRLLAAGDRRPGDSRPATISA